jgi:hypothetical protein
MYGVIAFMPNAKAQWVVTDPTNLAQGIVNSARQIIQTSTTATNMINNFKEVQKSIIKVKNIMINQRQNNLVKDARKCNRLCYLLAMF